MFEDRRNMDENVLRNNALGASNSETQTVQDAVMDAIAERGFADRQTNALTKIQNELMNRSLATQQNQLKQPDKR